jgi:hypothetical protein
MANELIRPIDADTAHAVEETAKAVNKTVEAALKTGNYVGGVLGDLPHNLVGIMGDWVAHKRARRWHELKIDTDKILRERGVEKSDASPSVAIPLIASAIDDDREVLKDAWAKLLAAAMDPARTNRVRISLIEALKNMDPLDARVLPSIRSGREALETLATMFGVSNDEISVSITHLIDLNLARMGGPLGPRATSSVPTTTPLGNLLLRAIED